MSDLGTPPVPDSTTIMHYVAQRPEQSELPAMNILHGTETYRQISHVYYVDRQILLSAIINAPYHRAAKLVVIWMRH